MNTKLVSLVIIGAILAAALFPSPTLAVPRTYTAMLTGASEVPPVPTMATGEATFALSDDGLALTYRLTVNNITDVTASHIHVAVSGVNGPVVVPLFIGPVKTGAFTGVLAEGTITAADLRGVLAGMPLNALVDRIETGGAYVNVHTTSRPGGEIRGQIHLAPMTP